MAGGAQHLRIVGRLGIGGPGVVRGDQVGEAERLRRLNADEAVARHGVAQHLDPARQRVGHGDGGCGPGVAVQCRDQRIDDRGGDEGAGSVMDEDALDPLGREPVEARAHRLAPRRATDDEGHLAKRRGKLAFLSARDCDEDLVDRQVRGQRRVAPRKHRPSAERAELLGAAGTRALAGGDDEGGGLEAIHRRAPSPIAAGPPALPVAGRWGRGCLFFRQFS